MGVEEKLWAQVDAVTDGFFRGVVKEFSGVVIVAFRRQGDKKTLWVSDT